MTFLLALLLAFQTASAGDFLPVDQAFELQPVEVRDGKAHIAWRITPGHFLYRTRLGFTSTAPGLKLGKPELGPGKPYRDEILGDTEIYDEDLAVRIPATGAGTLKVTYQGCAKQGLCYPPQTRELNVVSFPPKKKA